MHLIRRCIQKVVFPTLSFVGCIFYSAAVVAVEQVVVMPTMDSEYVGNQYEFAILKKALTLTESEYGPFEIVFPKHAMQSNRVLFELEKGALSVAVSAYKKQWEGKGVLVPFPLRKGISSIRLFFASVQNRAKFDNIKSLAQLKAFKFGQVYGWSTEKILLDNGFTVVHPDSYVGLFRMLLANRYDLFMRGTHEIFHERNHFYKGEDKIYIEDRFAFYTYLPTYFNVSKKQAYLAKRLEVGLKLMFDEGSLDTIFNSHYAQPIAMLKKAKPVVFHLKNTNLEPGMYERDKPYLLDLEGLFSSGG